MTQNNSVVHCQLFIYKCITNTTHTHTHTHTDKHKKANTKWETNEALWDAVTFLFRFCPLKLSLIIRSVGIRTRKATLPGRRRPFRIARVLIFSMSRRRRTTTTTTFCFVLSLSAENKNTKTSADFPLCGSLFSPHITVVTASEFIDHYGENTISGRQWTK